MCDLIISLSHLMLIFSILVVRRHAITHKRQRGSNTNEGKNVFSDRVSLLNENIDQMANQLSSIGKDMKNRVTSLSSTIQVTAVILPVLHRSA